MKRFFSRTLRVLRKKEEVTAEIDMSFNKPTGKKLYFGMGAGRSGSRWTSMVFSAHKGIVSLDEKFQLPEAFFRYCCWNNLPVDHATLYGLLSHEIQKQWQDNDIVYLQSPYLSNGLELVDEWFGVDGLTMCIREPAKVVNSMIGKGWYAEDSGNLDSSLISGLQHNVAPHHHFGRIKPRPHDRIDWKEMSQLERCTWYWATMNGHFLEKYEKFEGRKALIRLQDFDQNHEFYLRLNEHFKLSEKLTRERFLGLKGTAPNIGKHKRKVSDWSSKEKEEFDQAVMKYDFKYENVGSKFE